MSFVSEMKRRKVLRAAFVYLVTAWLLLQIVDVVGPILDMPGWVAKLIFFILLAGLPVMLVLSWQFDLTNIGIYREQPLDEATADLDGGTHEKRAGMHVAKCVSCLWTGFFGVGLSVGAAVVIHLHEARQIDMQYGLMASELAHEIDQRIESNGEALDAMRALFVENNAPHFETFRLLSEDIISRHPEMTAVEWVPRVTAANRTQVVSEVRVVYPGFDLKSFDAEGKETMSEKRDLYFPVTYTIPRSGNEAAIGFDLMSNPDRAKALQEANLTGRVSRSSVVRLVQSGQVGFLLVSPVFEKGQKPVNDEARLSSLQGFTLGVIDIRKLLDFAILAAPAMETFLGRISLYKADEQGGLPVIEIDTGNGSKLSGSSGAQAVTKGEPDQFWRVELQPSRATVVSQFSNGHFFVGITGVLLSILCSFLLYALMGVRESRIERDIPSLDNGTERMVNQKGELDSLNSLAG